MYMKGKNGYMHLTFGCKQCIAHREYCVFQPSQKNRTLFLPTAHEAPTQQCILHAARSHGVGCSVTTHTEDTARMQAEQTGRFLDTTVTCKSLACQWDAGDVLPQNYRLPTSDVAELDTRTTILA
jgi:hypothetical protein